MFFLCGGGGGEKSYIFRKKDHTSGRPHSRCAIYFLPMENGSYFSASYLIRYWMLPMEMYDTCFLTLFQKNLQIFFERDKKPVNLTSSNGVHEVYVPDFGGGSRSKLSQF